MGQQYVDLLKAQQLGTELLGPDGKIMHPSSDNSMTNSNCDTIKSKLALSSGNNKGSLEKNSTKTKENISSTCSTEETQYVCPRCAKTKSFSSLSNTYRHLINGKTFFRFNYY